MATTNTNVSIVDYLGSQGKASDYTSRAKMATEYGITGYKGTAEQNIQLLNKLKGAGTSTPVSTAPIQAPTNIQEANAYINKDQQANFATASKVDEPSVKSRYAEVTDLLKGSLAEKPAPVSMMETYTKLKADYGLTDLESNLNSLKAQARDIEAQKQARINSEKGKPVAMNVISGRVSEVEQQENERLAAINNSIQTATDTLKTKYDAVDTIMKFTATDYDNAVNSYDKQFNQNVAVMNMVRGIVEDEKSDQERVVDNARANAQIMINTMNSNGTTYDKLTSDQQANLMKLGVQSGLGSNFFAEVMKNSAGKEILTTITNDDKTKTTIMYKDGTTKVISTGLPAGSGVNPKTTKVNTSGSLTYSDSTLGKMGGALEKYRGVDGYVDANKYYEAYRDWVNAGGLATDFVKQFDPNTYVNPANKSLPTYLQNTSKTTGRSL